MKDQLKNLFAAIDQKDTDTFSAFLTEGASFRFSNAPAVTGRENIRKSVSGFFANIKGLNHRILEAWELNNALICEGEVAYTRLDDSKLTVLLSISCAWKKILSPIIVFILIFLLYFSQSK